MLLTEFFEDFFPHLVKRIHHSLKIIRGGRYSECHLGNKLEVRSILAFGCWVIIINITVNTVLLNKTKIQKLVHEKRLLLFCVLCDNL